MKIIAIGDTHGRKTWEQIVKRNMDADKIVFIGDYFDTHDNISQLEQIKNFTNIMNFKLAHPDKVVLLCGNHDFHYLLDMGEHYSGFNPEQASMIYRMLDMYIQQGKIQMVYNYKQFLFSHAGVTKTWVENSGLNALKLNLADAINNLFKYSPSYFKFSTEDKSNCGEHISQSPIWVRPDSLEKDRVEGYVHVVGHTMQPFIGLKGKVLLIDTIHVGEYLEIQDDSVITRSI